MTREDTAPFVILHHTVGQQAAQAAFVRAAGGFSLSATRTQLAATRTKNAAAVGLTTALGWPRTCGRADICIQLFAAAGIQAESRVLGGLWMNVV